jgi:hypothetical protein
MGRGGEIEEKYPPTFPHRWGLPNFTKWGRVMSRIFFRNFLLDKVGALLPPFFS